MSINKSCLFFIQKYFSNSNVRDKSYLFFMLCKFFVLQCISFMNAGSVRTVCTKAIHIQEIQ